MPTALAVLAASYLVGAVPVGFLLGLVKGVNLFRVGSGNIGATNVARTLGAKFGALCFLLDFLKGAVPVALAARVDPAVADAVGGPDVLRVASGALAFVGHLFPVYLGFRGGKGVATGAGVISVLVPGPAAVAILTWAVVTATSRAVSLGSVAAVTVLSAVRLADPVAFTPGPLVVTLFVVVGSVVVVAKHRGNVRRLLDGTENRIADSTAREVFVKALHLLAVGLWFGGAAFFNFGTAPRIFAAFRQVVEAGPSDRTAGEVILPADADEPRKAALANALAGSAVGPVFPVYFGMQAVCGGVALVTALGWCNAEGGRRVHRWRVGVLAAGLLSVAVAWPVSNKVSELRPLRFSPDPAVATQAKTDFSEWHLVSLGLSFVTIGLAGAGLAVGSVLPATPRPAPTA